MKLIGGKSYENGIDFSVHDGKKSFVYSARRNEQGDIVTSRSVMYQKTETNTLSKTVVSAIVSILLVLILYFFRDFENELLIKVGWLLAIIVFWFGFLSFLFLDGRSARNSKVARYHSVEHKILNFYEDYGYFPRTTMDIEKMSSLYIGCGSTVAVVIALFTTLVAINVMFVPTIILKIVGIVISGIATLYCWAIGKCDFAQKWMLKKPTHEEIELGVCAMHRLAKEISVL